MEAKEDMEEKEEEKAKDGIQDTAQAKEEKEDMHHINQEETKARENVCKEPATAVVKLDTQQGFAGKRRRTKGKAKA